MKIYMILGTVVTLLFSPHQPTTVQFESPIEYFSIGNTGDFDSYLSKNKKILLIRPKKEAFDAFLVVITKNKSYEFRLKDASKILTALYQIHDGGPEKFYRFKNNGEGYKILEGEKSLKIIRTTKAKLVVNGRKVDKQVTYYPKNAHLKINGKEVD